ncbi:MAG TPA: amidohydrolase family protein [Candidatus Binatia bacterium]
MKPEWKPGGLSRRDFIKGAAAGAAVVAGGSALLGAEHAVPLASAAGVPVCPDGTEDVALVNGRFLTLDKDNTVVGAVTIRNGRFAEIGTIGTLRPCAQTIDLQGRTVIPGLIDSHVHFIRCGINPGHEVRIIETATSIAELQQMISDRIKALGLPAGEFLTCVGGWNRNGIGGALPTPAQLDAAAPNNPVYLSETGGGGAGLTNTLGRAFFESRGVTVNAATGVLNANQGLAALQAVQTEADKLRGTAEVCDFAASIGLTGVHDHGGLSGLAPYNYALALWRQGQLKTRQRIFLWSGDDSGFTTEQTRIISDLNRIGDDVFHTLGVGERLNTNTTNPGFIDACKFAASSGWTLTQHSLTAAEVAFHISAYQAAAAVGTIDKFRWSLCHVNPITDAQIQTVKQLGIGLNIQGTQYTSGAGATPGGPPFRKLLDAGIPCGGGSDATNVAALNPWLMMFYMTTAKNNAGVVINADQTITRLEALRMYTSGSAYLSFDDDRLGTIETGKLADLVVLNDNPLTVSDDQFKKLHSVMTLQAGKTIYSAAS